MIVVCVAEKSLAEEENYLRVTGAVRALSHASKWYCCWSHNKVDVTPVAHSPEAVPQDIDVCSLGLWGIAWGCSTFSKSISIEMNIAIVALAAGAIRAHQRLPGPMPPFELPQSHSLLLIFNDSYTGQFWNVQVTVIAYSDIVMLRRGGYKMNTPQMYEWRGESRDILAKCTPGRKADSMREVEGVLRYFLC